MKESRYGYSEYQTAKRQETLDKIQFAIDELKSEGAIITKPRLVERTHFSRALFDKIHVLELLKKNGVCEFAPKVVIEKTPSSSVTELSKQLTVLEKENLLLKTKVEKLTAKSNKYQEDYLKVKEDYQTLLGEWHLLLKLAQLKGLEIEKYMK